MKKNDVYQFHYNDEYRESNYDPYHCFDGILIVRENGNEIYLEDTYWSHGNRIFTPADVETLGTATFVCNLDEVKTIHESEVRYYDESDVFVLRMHHGHREQTFLRNGAQRSPEKMIRHLEAQIVDSKQRIKFHTDLIVQYELKLAEVKSGNTEIYI